MRTIDNIPIMIVIFALLINIAIGITNNISFSALMIRCIVVTVIFGVFGYMVIETIKNAIECSELKSPSHGKGEKDEGLTEIEDSNNGSKPMLDIKVPPLNDEEFISMDNDSDIEFVEVNPVYMGNYKSSKQD